MDATAAYATLGLPLTASVGDLRQAYRAALQRYHPDTGAGDLRALESVTAAYRELRTRRLAPAALRASAAAQSVGRWPQEPPPVGSLVDVYA